MPRVVLVAIIAALVLLTAVPVLAATGGSGWGPGNGQIQFTFAPAGKVSALGIAPIKVTWSCGTGAVPWTAPASLDFNLTLTQPVNRTQSVQAQVFGSQPCTPGTSNTTVPAQFVPSQGMFEEGGAFVQGQISGCDNAGQCDTENVVMTLKLP